MKRLLSAILLIVCIVSISACSSDEPKEVITAESALTVLKESSSDVTEIIVYTEETDPNENLGRPNQYIGKGDFNTASIEDDETGTIEFFKTESDCDERYEYLCSLSSADMGVFGVNQYIYKYDLAVFRISYDVTPTEATEFKTLMDEIIGEKSVLYETE